ncbi:hypothetical protein PENTCL1PPCAC_1544 [Pristionchus entomophagus]|uniref:Uncharacterized protein n=1 Tax=Pristionchus entomophagus TaxID=358040 RepID=A0AAV5S9S2_9BILA|nr:hypothetical protein PENTCL1PPCAC_1544 [Pristionchus entomophagus]
MKEHLSKAIIERVCSNVIVINLGAFPSDTTCQLDVLGHDCHSFGMDGTEIGVLKQTDEICFSCLLKSSHGSRLETEIRLEILSDLTNQTLERELANQKLGRFLVTSDLTESDGSGTIAMGLLDTTGRRSRLASRLSGQLLARSLSSSGFAGGLLGASHSKREERRRARKERINLREQGRLL